nr:collagen alpha-1(I) chain-like [Anser cygnoides]
MFALGVRFLRFYFYLFIYFPCTYRSSKKHAPRLLPAVGSESRGAPEQSAANAGGEGRAGIWLAPTGAAPGGAGLLGGLPAPRGSGGSAAGRSEGEPGVRDPPQLCPGPRGSRSPWAAGDPAPPGHFWEELDGFSAPSPGAQSDVSAPQGAGEGRRRGRAGETWHRGIFHSHFSELTSSK